MQWFPLRCDSCGVTGADCTDGCKCAKCVDPDSYYEWKYSTAYKKWLKKKATEQGFIITEAVAFTPFEKRLPGSRLKIVYDEAVRLAVGAFTKALETSPEELVRITGMDEELARRLYSKKSLILMGIKNDNWDMVFIHNRDVFWKRVLFNAYQSTRKAI